MTPVSGKKTGVITYKGFLVNSITNVLIIAEAASFLKKNFSWKRKE